MSAEDAIANIRAKQGLKDKSFDCNFHADQLQLIVTDLKTLSFSASTINRVPLTGGLSDDGTDPTLITGLTMTSQIGGFELVTTGAWADTGAVLNNTGFDVDDLGAFDFYPNNTGGTSRIDMWSETSTDGVTITVNELSARSIEVSGTGESSDSKVSKAFDWKHGEMLRFAFTDSGGGSIAFEQASVSGRGQVILSPSFGWQLVTTRRVAV